MTADLFGDRVDRQLGIQQAEDRSTLVENELAVRLAQLPSPALTTWKG